MTFLSRFSIYIFSFVFLMNTESYKVEFYFSGIATQILGLQGGTLRVQDAHVRRHRDGRDGRSGHDCAVHLASLESLGGFAGSASLAAAVILLERASMATRISMRMSRTCRIKLQTRAMVRFEHTLKKNTHANVAYLTVSRLRA